MENVTVLHWVDHVSFDNEGAYAHCVCGEWSAASGSVGHLFDEYHQHLQLEAVKEVAKGLYTEFRNAGI